MSFHLKFFVALGSDNIIFAWQACMESWKQGLNLINIRFMNTSRYLDL